MTFDTLKHADKSSFLPHALAFKTLPLVDMAQDYKHAPVGIPQ